MRDPYDVLGVPRGASASAIKSAFRKLAKKLHPDANTNDPKAATRFSELNSAYEILGDEKKRKAFDNGEIDAEGKPRFAGFEGAHPGDFAQGGGSGGFGPGTHFETFSWGPGGGLPAVAAARAAAAQPRLFRFRRHRGYPERCDGRRRGACARPRVAVPGRRGAGRPARTFVRSSRSACPT